MHFQLKNFTLFYHHINIWLDSIVKVFTVCILFAFFHRSSFNKFNLNLRIMYMFVFGVKDVLFIYLTPSFTSEL